MDESELVILIRATFSACFLVASADGEITDEEVRAFMGELHARYDIELEADDVADSFGAALELEQEEHLERIAEAQALPESVRHDILSIAMVVASADGEVDIHEILCLPDIAAALGVELSEDDESEVDVADTEGAELSEQMREAFDAAEAELRAEGVEAPSAADIQLRAVGEQLSDLSGSVRASLLQREGYAAYEAGDFEKARQLYVAAAQGGDADAMFNLGQMHMAGEGVPLDWSKALKWWLDAAEQGHLSAQRNAWKTLAWGQEGVSPDEVKAIEIAALAAEQGDEESAEFVRKKTHRSLKASSLIAARLMARADGLISHEEMVAFGDTWKELLGIELSSRELDGLFNADVGDLNDESAIMERITSLTANLPLEFRQQILHVSLLVALSDQEVAPAEQAMVLKLADALQVDLSDLGIELATSRPAEESNHASPPMAGKNLEQYDPNQNPVLVAALHGDEEQLRRLLSEGHSATDVHVSGTDALILAVGKGHRDIVDILIGAGADLNRINPKTGMTALRLAMQELRGDIAELLLLKGADPELHDRASGISPLAVLVSAASDFEEEEGEALRMLDLLISAGAKQHPFFLEGHKFTMIGFAACRPDQPTGFLSRLAETASQEDLDMALYSASFMNQAENINELIRAGADVNMTVPLQKDDPDAVGDSPLNVAAAWGHIECAQLLIRAGAEVDRSSPPEGGLFPLLSAAQYDHVDIVAALLDAGADLTKINPENGAQPLGSAVGLGHSEVVKLLLDAGADPNDASDLYGGSLLALAAHQGHLEIVEHLINHGADVDAVQTGIGTTALMSAAMVGRADIIEVLLRSGADVAKKSLENETDALLPAVVGKHGRCVQLLLEAGADPNQTFSTNVENVPLLTIASEKGSAEITRLLLESGAEVNATDGEGLTALQRAGIHSHRNVEAVLIEFGANPDERLVKFSETLAGQGVQNTLLRDLADTLEEGVEALRDMETAAPAKKEAPAPKDRGFWSRLFGGSGRK